MLRVYKVSLYDDDGVLVDYWTTTDREDALFCALHYAIDRVGIVQVRIGE